MLSRSVLILALGLPWLAACARAPEPPSVLLFAVDTLRADRVGALTHGTGAPDRGLTPRIDAFAASGRVFEAAYAQATQTHPSMASVMTGLAPPHHGVTTQAVRHREGLATLAEVLQEEGYRTGSFVANLCHLQDRGRTVWSDGWDTQFCGEDLSREQHEWDRAVVDAGLEWIEGGDEPFFAWFHLMDPHGEYRPPPEEWDYAARPVPEAFEQSRFYGSFLERYELPPPEVVAELEALYDAQIPGVDRQFGRVIDALEADGRLANTVVVFLSDHGEELFGTWPKAGHGFSLTEGVLRVPLIVAGPGVEPGRVSEVVELLQVTPTVLELLGVEAPYPFDGGSLLGERPGRGWAASFIGDRATVRRAEQRWWGRSQLLREPDAVRDFLLKYPSHREAPWYRSNQLMAAYPDDAVTPVWLDLDDGPTSRAAQVMFRRPINTFLREGESEAADVIEDPAFLRRLEELGYQ